MKNIKDDMSKPGRAKEFLKGLVNPFGAEGDKGGIGASFLFEVMTNVAKAVIEGRASITVGRDPTAVDADTGERTDGLRVSASTTIFDLAFVQAGASGSSFAITGAFPVAVINNTTRAQINRASSSAAAGPTPTARSGSRRRTSSTGSA